MGSTFTKQKCIIYKHCTCTLKQISKIAPIQPRIHVRNREVCFRVALKRSQNRLYYYITVHKNILCHRIIRSKKTLNICQTLSLRNDMNWFWFIMQTGKMIKLTSLYNQLFYIPCGQIKMIYSHANYCQTEPNENVDMVSLQCKVDIIRKS